MPIVYSHSHTFFSALQGFQPERLLHSSLDLASTGSIGVAEIMESCQSLTERPAFIAPGEELSVAEVLAKTVPLTRECVKAINRILERDIGKPDTSDLNLSKISREVLADSPQLAVENALRLVSQGKLKVSAPTPLGNNDWEQSFFDIYFSREILKVIYRIPEGVILPFAEAFTPGTAYSGTVTVYDDKPLGEKKFHLQAGQDPRESSFKLSTLQSFKAKSK